MIEWKDLRLQDNPTARPFPKTKIAPLFGFIAMNINRKIHTQTSFVFPFGCKLPVVLEHFGLISVVELVVVFFTDYGADMALERLVEIYGTAKTTFEKRSR